VRIDVVTLFPELFEPFLSTGMVGRAVRQGALRARFKSPRDFGHGRHRSVDDTPYGGGSGMVMRVDCVVAALEALDAERADAEPRARRILLTPQGARLRQPRVVELATLPALCLVCGRYEGFDERVRAFVDEELSLGDFVLTGGELAAMTVIDACSRMIPGVLGNEQSARDESHSAALAGMLEYPQYTRPVDFRGMAVPAILQSGNHAEIDAWRRAEALARTRARRPDLVPGAADDQGDGGQGERG
jgi:tRNA (guanine37-N1)-methyltransferase